MTSLAARLSLRGRLPAAGIGSGMSAIIVKELRGRMRGRRAFIVLTIHVLLLAGIAWMLQRINEESIANFGGFGGQVTFASASVGRGIFVGLMLLQTLMVSVLAPAATAGAISSEREHQTLDLLTVTPISSLAIVLGKLLSALAWVFVLILASVPITALVFVFGGVAPDDLLRGYIVLFATVIGLGSVGIFFSALTRRTGAATGLTFVTTLVLTIGSIFIFAFLSSTSDVGPNGLRRQPPSALLFLNPFVAQIDVSCGTEDGGFGGSCGFMSSMLGTQFDFVQPDFPVTKPLPGIDVDGPGFAPVPAFGGPGPVVGGGVIRADGANVVVIGRGGGGLEADVVVNAADGLRDRFWPKTVISFLVLATILTTASVQFVSPTRKWRPSLPGRVRRRLRRRSAT